MANSTLRPAACAVLVLLAGCSFPVDRSWECRDAACDERNWGLLSIFDDHLSLGETASNCGRRFDVTFPREGGRLRGVDARHSDLRIAYMTADGDVWLGEFGSAVESAHLADAAADGLAWSPDGRRLAVLTDTGSDAQLLILDEELNELDALEAPWLATSRGDPFLPSHGMSWSADGRWIAISHFDSATTAVIELDTARELSVPLAGGQFVSHDVLIGAEHRIEAALPDARLATVQLSAGGGSEPRIIGPMEWVADADPATGTMLTIVNAPPAGMFAFRTERLGPVILNIFPGADDTVIVPLNEQTALVRDRVPCE